MEAYLKLKERISLGAQPLSAVWEDTVSRTFPQRVLAQPASPGLASQLPSHRRCRRDFFASSPFVLVGVKHNTLVGQAALDAALGCRSTLVENGFGDVHVIILGSVFSFFHSKGLYEPTITANPVGVICESFSTSLGISVCPAESTNLEGGIGGFFFLDKTKPGVLYFFTARHFLIDLDQEGNELFTFRDGSPQEVLFMGKATFESRCKAIESAIIGQQLTIDYLNRRLEVAQKMEDEEEGEMERTDIANQMARRTKAVEAYQKLLNDVARDWKDERNCIIGHVTLSPPIGFDYGNEGFTDDWAVVEVYPSIIVKLNFVGNAINLAAIAVDELTAWMDPHQSSFSYPGNRLLRFGGLISDEEMFKPYLKTNLGHDNIMVMKT